MLAAAQSLSRFHSMSCSDLSSEMTIDGPSGGGVTIGEDGNSVPDDGIKIYVSLLPTPFYKQYHRYICLGAPWCTS